MTSSPPQVGTTTVAQLIFALSRLDPDALVVLSEDSEGNGFSPLTPLEGLSVEGYYRAYTTFSGEFHGVYELVDPDCEFEPDPGDVKAVCLWPIN